MNSFADVAELADAQVSEACDGDIVEVQVLSSAPGIIMMRAPEPGARFVSIVKFSVSDEILEQRNARRVFDDVSK